MADSVENLQEVKFERIYLMPQCYRIHYIRLEHYKTKCDESMRHKNTLASMTNPLSK